ncbi:MAG: rRNA maturation RNase YbeY [Clostridia bacterium]|nr:rRNA maturation RNase YbeY [Clostridia bacterium]
MSGFIIDCDEDSFANARAIETALSGFVETDVPLAIEVSFVGEEEIQRLNRELRGVDKITDVLSFPALDLERGQAIQKADYPFEIDEEGRLLLGSIAICIKRAREQAEEYGHSYERELHYLLVHGIMHCLGYDHMEENEKAQMREKEEIILNKLGITR